MRHGHRVRRRGGGVRRWLLNILAGISLLLLLLTSAAWIRSYWRQDWISRFRYKGGEIFTQAKVGSTRGFLCVSISWSQCKTGDPDFIEAQRVASDRWEVKSYDDPTRHGVPAYKCTPVPRLWVDQPSFNGQVVNHISLIDMPYWSIAGAWAVMPCLKLASWRINRSRRLNGMCQSCGYDLRASKDRCPECGTAIRRAAAAEVV
jgi:predicted RNA-binding Zn-ribbon protein involved in translation (DUF1610 family)